MNILAWIEIADTRRKESVKLMAKHMRSIENCVSYSITYVVNYDITDLYYR